MPSITIKNIPEHLYLALKQRAKANHRSVNGEVIACVERSVLASSLDTRTRLAAADDIRGRQSGPPIDEEFLSAAKNTGRP